MLKDNLSEQSSFFQINLSKRYSMLQDNSVQTVQWLAMLSENSSQITFIVTKEIIHGQN